MALAPVFCLNCGAANETASERCFACGQALEETGNAASVEAELVKQRYRVLRQVGTGGFGAVYLAQDTQAKNQQVALKRINLAGLKPQEIIEATDAFNREVSLLPGLRHPHLPRVYDHFTDPDHWYLVMQFIEGETLETYVQKHLAGHLSVEAVIDTGIQIAGVLHYLHSHQPPIIFRDLKPANIMRTPGGELFLIDFGIARIFKPGQARDTIAFGSPGYAPPEQYGKAQTTAQADLYSLGATLHALLTGDDPASTPFSFAPLSLPSQPAIAHLERLIMQMVELDADKRPDSARAVKQELQDIVTELLQERLQALYPVNMPQNNSYVPLYIPPSAAGSGTAGQIQVGLPSQAASARRGRSRRRFIRISAGVILTTAVGGGLMQFLGNFQDMDGPDGGPVPPPIPQRFPLGSGPLGTTYYTLDGSSFVRSVTWSPNGKYIAYGGYDRLVQVIDAASGNVLNTYKEVLDDPVFALTWSPDSRYIASAARIIEVWPALRTAKAGTEYTGHRIPVNAAAWSPDGRYIASAAENVQVWDAKTGKRISLYAGHTGQVNTVAWSPDGKYLASAGTDNTVRIWKPFQTQDTLFTYSKHTDQINSISWSLDGKYIASAGDAKDMTVYVWDAHNGKTIYSYGGHESAVRAVAWSPTLAGRIASAGEDNAVHIWDITASLSFPYIYSHDNNWVVTLSWSPDGKYLVSGSFDGNIRVWQAV